MELIHTIFDTLFFIPLVNFLIAIYKVLESAGIPGALGLSIAIISIIVRFIIWPFTASQVKSTQKMSAIKPHLDALKKKHKDDKSALQVAQMALYKEHGINPAGGCLPMLIQFPMFIAIYQAILVVFPGQGQNALDKINAILYSSWLHLSTIPDPNIFGVSLAWKPSDFNSHGMLLLLVPVITGALTFVQSRMMAPAKPLTIAKNDSPKEIKEKEGMEDALSSMQTQMVFLMPIMIGYFSFQFPIGLAIYWNTFTIMGIIQQYSISGWGGMKSIVDKIKR